MCGAIAGAVLTGYKNVVEIGKGFSHFNIRYVEMGGDSIAVALAGDLPTERFIYEHLSKKECAQNILSFGVINGNEFLHRIQFVA